MSVKGEPRRTRRESAQATRRAIVAAARTEFEGSGFHGATMAGIARRAGVAVQTVYFVFHTKAELLSAAIDTAVLGDSDPTPPPDTAWWASVVAEPRADVALRTFVRGACEVLARASALSEVARTAALTDPEAGRTHQRHETLRVDGYRQIIELLASKTALRSGLDVGSATDVLVTLVGPGTYMTLTQDRGWTHDQVTAWLEDCLPDILLAPTGRRRAAGPA